MPSEEALSRPWNFPHDIGEYELLEEISRGGIGIVFKARQKKLDRLVALKMLRLTAGSDPEAIKRFRSEAVVAASLHHRNIVAIHEVGVYQDEHFIVMDLVDGPSLARFVKGEPLPPKRAAGYLKGIADAIHYAHERGILHRDLKPSNVLVDATDQPRVTDFGLAKRLTGDVSMTVTGQVIGSPGYMPPEQAAGGKASRASDVYSLGAMLYHLLTGRPPFTGETLDATLHQIFTREPIPPRLLNSAVPADLETICLKCLEKEPSRRFETAQELADELERFLRGEPTVTRPVGPAGKVWRWSRRKPALAAMTVLSGAALFLGAWGVLWQWRRAEGHALELRRNLYASDMRLAHQAVAAHLPRRARELLSKHIPASGQEDLRGWEWRYLWSQCRNDALFTVCHRPRPIASLSVSPNGKWLAIGDETGGEVAVWDWEAKRRHALLHVGADAALTAFSPAESLLAIANGRGMIGYFEAGLRSTVQLWDPATQQAVGSFSVHGACRRQILFTPDGEHLVTAENVPNRGNPIHFWRIPSGEQTEQFFVRHGDGQHGPVWPVALAADGGALAIGTPGPLLRVVDTGSWRERWSAPTHDDVVTIAFSPDGRFVASSSGLGASTVQIWDAQSGTELALLEGHRGWVSALVFWPDGTRLASTGGDRTIRIWDLTHVPGAVSSRVLVGHASEVWGLALLPDKRTLVSAGKDGSVLAWDTTQGSGDSGPRRIPRIRSFRWVPGEQSLLLVNMDGEIVRMSGGGGDLSNREVLMKIHPAWGAAFSEDGRYVATTGDSSIKVFDLERCLLIREREFKDPTSPDRAFYPVRFAAGNTQVIARLASTDYHEVWDFVHDRSITSWRSGHNPAVPLPDEGQQIEFPREGEAMLRDLKTGKTAMVPMRVPSASGAASSPDRRLIAVSSWMGGVKLWNARTRKLIAEVDGFQQSSHAVSFSPDGQRLAAGGNGEEAIKIWTVDGVEELLTISAEGSVFANIAFSPDGSLLAGASQDGVLHIWHAPSFEEIGNSLSGSDR